MDAIYSIKRRLMGSNTDSKFSNMAHSRISSPFEPMESRRYTRPLKFYLGVFLCTAGFFLLLAGSVQNNWVLLNYPAENVPNSTKVVLAARFGPWKACRHNGDCGELWEVLAGVDSSSAKVTQTFLAFILVIYIVGIVVIFLQLLTPTCDFLNGRVCSFIRRQALPEVVLSVAVVLNFVCILLMGEIKRMVIVRFDQSINVGPGFALTLSGICITVSGIVFMIFNRKPSSTSFMNRYMFRAASWSDNFKKHYLNKKGVNSTTVEASANYSRFENDTPAQKRIDEFDIKVHNPRQTKRLQGKVHQSNSSPDLKRQKTHTNPSNRDGGYDQQLTTDRTHFPTADVILPQGEAGFYEDGATSLQRRHPRSDASHPKASDTEDVKVHMEHIPKQLNIEPSWMDLECVSSDFIHQPTT